MQGIFLHWLIELKKWPKKRIFLLTQTANNDKLYDEFGNLRGRDSLESTSLYLLEHENCLLLIMKLSAKAPNH